MQMGVNIVVYVFPLFAPTMFVRLCMQSPTMAHVPPTPNKTQKNQQEIEHNLSRLSKVPPWENYPKYS